MEGQYVYLHLDAEDIRRLIIEGEPTSATVKVKLDDEGIVVDLWSNGELITYTWERYQRMEED